MSKLEARAKRPLSPVSARTTNSWSAQAVLRSLTHLLRGLGLVALLGLVGLRADFAYDLALLHREASGGEVRINELKGFKAIGVTRSPGVEMPFVLIAARPNRIWTEVDLNGAKLRQGWDGITPPWSTDSRTKKISLMQGEAAESFKAEAEFDDPLLAGHDRKVSLDYVGETVEEGRGLLKLMVTQNFTETSYVYLDPETYLIVRRDVLRKQTSGDVVLRTDFSDFQPVRGVILPHRLVVWQGNKRLRETIISRMEPNPELPPDLFTAPRRRAP